MFDSASCEKKAFSPTERWIEKCSVATHTQLGRISAPNIWALGPLKNCGVLSPRLICSRGWKRSNGGEPLHRAGLWSFSKEFFFFFIQGRGHHYWGLRERKGAQHLGDFLFGIGIRVFDVGGRGRSAPRVLSGNLGINHCLFLLAPGHLKILPQSWKGFWGFSFVVRVPFEKLSIQTSYLVSSWVTNPYFCYQQQTQMISFSSTLAVWDFIGVASGYFTAVM